MEDASLGVNPSPLRPTVHQDGEGGGRNALFHPTHPRLWESPAPKDIREKTPVSRVIGLSKVHIPRKTDGAISTPCCNNLLCLHDIVRHLSTRNKGRLEWANQRWKYPREPIGQHLCKDQIRGVGQ